MNNAIGMNEVAYSFLRLNVVDFVTTMRMHKMNRAVPKVSLAR